MLHEQVLGMIAQAMVLFVEELCAALQLAPPFTAEELRDKIQVWKRCRIDILPYPMLDEDVFGLCVCKRPYYYVIFYRAGASYVQRQRIIFHELCHIILSHVSPANPVVVLRKSLAATFQELEAETFAQIETSYALADQQQPAQRSSADTADDRYNRFARKLEG